MSTQWQRLARIGFLVIAVSACLPAASAADPVRITVDFTVEGSPQDPDFGLATSSGSFSVVTTLVRGSVVLRRSGFGADELSFSWAGASWTTANADVVQLALDESGAVSLWHVGGSPAGLSAVSFASWPDFSAAFCGFCGPEGESSFFYTTRRSPDVGIFTGRMTSLSMRTDAAAEPVPEPASLLLITGTLVGLVAKRRAAVGSCSRVSQIRG